LGSVWFGSVEFVQRVFPYLLNKAHAPFSFSRSKFKVPRSKETTARVVCARELEIVASYTIEVGASGVSRRAASVSGASRRTATRDGTTASGWSRSRNDCCAPPACARHRDASRPL